MEENINLRNTWKNLDIFDSPLSRAIHRLLHCYVQVRWTIVAPRLLERARQGTNGGGMQASPRHLTGWMLGAASSTTQHPHYAWRSNKAKSLGRKSSYASVYIGTWVRPRNRSRSSGSSMRMSFARKAFQKVSWEAAGPDKSRSSTYTDRSNLCSSIQ